MKFLEKDLEEIIFNANQMDLNERGLDFNSSTNIKKRQLRIGEYGVADIVTYQKPYFETDYNINDHCNKPTISVIELKKDVININTFLQAVRYLKGIMRYLEKVKKRDIDNYHFKIILIGSSITTSSDFIYLTEIINSSSDANTEGCTFDLMCYVYNYDFDGISFNYESYYKLKNEGF